MDIVRVDEFGGPEVLRVRQADDPVAGPGQVVIGVAAVDVMSLDAQLRTGWGKEWFGHRPPFVPGTGVTGTVLTTGDGVDASWAGRRVAALLPGGGYAGQVAAPLESVVPVPDDVPLVDAAALLQVGPAALSLVDAAGLAPGTRVLVTGAGGGLGLVLVELAARAGAHVTAAARGAAKRARALELGAAEAIGYLDGDGGPRFDVVFDGVGGPVGSAASKHVAPGGVFFAYGVPSGSFAEADDGVKVVGIEQVQFTPEELGRLVARTFGAGLTPTVGLAVPLDRAAEAHAALEARELVGKAVLLATSRAVRYTEYGDAGVLRVVGAPIPRPGPGQVRVRVRAAGVNAIDWKLRAGLMGTPLTGPTGTGLEMAGVVDGLGKGSPGSCRATRSSGG
ncbi:zinc-binding dehydrogenase [Nonomuraea sp. NBC_01738]|uniref:alcohol dehydrogenase catalytic domain-containing protein n=1 Tax=Nonomuraea sp. NBC_01738 TaxID=2976003 RepID=UPI002E1272C3|nr:zinc-binding dehydrogenase [Nonomuraea sp. NBC_01738]